MVVEGMFTAEAAHDLAAREGVEMPIAEAIYNVDEFCSFEEYFGVEGGDYYE